MIIKENKTKKQGYAEQLFLFFQKFKLNKKFKITSTSYWELADQLGTHFNHSSYFPYIQNLSLAMKEWQRLWDSRNIYGCFAGPCSPLWYPVASKWTWSKPC